MRGHGTLQDGILGVIAGEERDAGQGEGADPHHGIGDGDFLPDAAHFADILLLRHRMDDGAGAEEEQRLEEGMGEEVEHRRLIQPHAGGEEHVAELRAGGIGDDALDVVLHATNGRGEERGGGADHGDDGECGGGEFHHRRHARHEEDAGGDHSGGVDEGGDRGGAFHGIRQPSVQAKLGGFAAGAEEEQHADHFKRGQAHELRLGLGGGGGEDGGEFDRAEGKECQRHAQHEEQIAHAVDDKSLHGGGAGALLLVPIADEQVAREAHTLPAEEELDEIIGGDQHQHHEGEEAEIGEEARARRVMAHIADGVDMDEGGDEGHHSHHDRRERVVAQRPGEFEITNIEPGGDLHRAGLGQEGDLPEGQRATERRGCHAQHGHPLRCPVTQPAAEEAVKGCTQQGEENGSD